MSTIFSGMRVNGPVFFTSAGLILAFVIFGASAPETASRVFSALQ